MQFTQRGLNALTDGVIGESAAGVGLKNFLTPSRRFAMHIKPPTSSPVAPQTPKPAPAAANKGGDFAQMLKTAQADTPAAPTQTQA